MAQRQDEKRQAGAVAQHANEPGQRRRPGPGSAPPIHKPSTILPGPAISLSTRRSGEGRRARPCGSGCCRAPRRRTRRRSPPARPGSTASAARTTTAPTAPATRQAMPSAIRRSKFSWKMNQRHQSRRHSLQGEHQRRGARFGEGEAEHEKKRPDDPAGNDRTGEPGQIRPTQCRFLSRQRLETSSAPHDGKPRSQAGTAIEQPSQQRRIGQADKRFRGRCGEAEQQSGQQGLDDRPCAHLPFLTLLAAGYGPRSRRHEGSQG